jgi:hypothetical protein
MRRIRWEYLLVFILIFTLCSELIWQVTQLFEDKPSFSFSTSKTGQKFILNYHIQANIMLDAKVLLVPVIEESASDKSIYVFYDPSYPAIGTGWSNVHMLWSSLQREKFLRGFEGNLELVSAKELEGLMSNKKRVAIIIASGAFPANVFSRDTDLVTPWLNSGGILLWFGYPPGYYTVYEGQVENTAFWSLHQNLLEEGVNRIGLGGFFKIDPYPLNGTLETAENSSYTSNLLDINYNIIQYGLLSANFSQEGMVLGKTGGNPSKSSVSVISVGVGKVVVFGFFVLGSYVLNGPELSAGDVAQILDSGILYASKSLMPVYTEHYLLARESSSGSLELEMNSSVKGVVVYVYSTITSNCFLYHSEFIPNT